MTLTKISHKELLERKPTISQLRSRKRLPVYVLLDNIRSLHNVGAIFRTCDAAFVEKIFLTGVTGKPPHKDIDKTALGAVEVVPWEYREDPVALLKELKKEGITPVALEITHESVPYSEAHYNFPLCLVIGSEVDGVSPEVLNECTKGVSIPMLGRASSLNVATATGIALFEVLRQYRTMHP